MIELFQKIPVGLPKPVDYMNKGKMLLTDIGGKWLMEMDKSTLSPIKIPMLIK